MDQNYLPTSNFKLQSANQLISKSDVTESIISKIEEKTPIKTQTNHFITKSFKNISMVTPHYKNKL